MNVPSILVASTILLLGVASTADAARDIGEIEACVRRNLPERTTHQKVRFKAVDRIGGTAESQAEIFWRKFDKGSRALLRFGAPPDIRGSALLVIQKPDRNDMFMFLPELQKVRRVSGHSVAGSMFGTDFAYEDFERLQGMSEAPETTQLPEADIDGRAVWVLQSVPAAGQDSRYKRIVSYVDQQTCVALRTELYESDERLRKVLKAPRERIIKKGRGWFPTLLLMKDMIDETHTELMIDEIEIDTELPRKLFSERALQQSR